MATSFIERKSLGAQMFIAVHRQLRNERCLPFLLGQLPLTHPCSLESTCEKVTWFNVTQPPPSPTSTSNIDREAVTSHDSLWQSPFWMRCKGKIPHLPQDSHDWRARSLWLHGAGAVSPVLPAGWESLQVLSLGEGTQCLWHTLYFMSPTVLKEERESLSSHHIVIF